MQANKTAARTELYLNTVFYDNNGLKLFNGAGTPIRNQHTRT